MTEILSSEPVELSTHLAGLKLRQMLTVDDDKQYLEFEKHNEAHIKEFGNSVDGSLELVTKRRLEHGNFRFGIWQDDAFIGMVGCAISKNGKDAEVGVLLDKDATGKGYAGVAVQALTDFALTRFERVFAEVDPSHTKSINLLNRSGYKTKGQIVVRDWGEALVFEAPKKP